MFVSRNQPKGARFALFGLGLCIFALMPTEIGYQDIASLLARQPGVAERWQKRVFASAVGSIQVATYSFGRDAVNAAARLTDLAKDTPGLVLTNAGTLRAANEVEQQRWTLMKSVELRGRGKMTQLARPVRSTMADRA